MRLLVKSVSGFIQSYDTEGAPELAQRVQELLQRSGISLRPCLYFEDRLREDGSTYLDAIRLLGKGAFGSDTDGSCASQGEDGATSAHATDGEQPGAHGTQRRPNRATSRSMDDESPPQDRRVWTVVGGEGTGGISVREEMSVKSSKPAERLATGSKVEELERGWVTTQIGGRRLLEPGPAELRLAELRPSSDLPVAIMFPGESCQYRGMLGTARRWPAVQEMLAKASDILGYDVFEMIQAGPEFLLAQANYSQPALFITALASLEKLRRRCPEVAARASAMVGFGVGHYTALCAAGAVTFEDGLRLVQRRAEAMAKAHALGRHAVAVCCGLEYSVLTALCEQAAAMEGPTAECMIVHHLFMKGYEVAGTVKAVFHFMDLAKEAGAVLVRIQNMAVASESRLMRPALEGLGAALQEALPHLKPPMQTVWTTGARPRPLNAGCTVAGIAAHLQVHLTEAVYWPATVEAMVRCGIQHFYDLSPQAFILSIMRRIDRRAHFKLHSIDVGKRQGAANRKERER